MEENKIENPKLIVQNASMRRDDWRKYTLVRDIVDNLLLEGGGGTIVDGVDYKDVTINSSKEEIKLAIMFLQAMLPCCLSEEELYGENQSKKKAKRKAKPTMFVLR